jgi:hypothetical protein
MIAASEPSCYTDSTLTSHYEDDSPVDSPPTTLHLTVPPATEMSKSSMTDAIQLLVNGLDTMIASNDPTNVVRGIVMLREDSRHHAPTERWQDLEACHDMEYMVANQKRDLQELQLRVLVLTKTITLTEHILEKSRKDLHININRDLIDLEPKIRHMFD